ncbi:unnamed protein product [Diatraea saccharalis]|uniref:Uncharacterized protein n=1 Tax=Diatraea saccharalis TaxID=40085 RepID=A0A9N9REB7_9NEOP|nr:unnamed protein product [Diatraea saccharalis]
MAGHTPHRVSSLGGTPATPGSPLGGEPGEAVIIINESPIMGSSVAHRPHSPSQSSRVVLSTISYHIKIMIS